MTLKQRIVASLVVLTLMLMIGGGGIWYIVENAPRSDHEARAGMLGSATATLGCIILAVIWFPYAYQVGVKKRTERERKSKP